MTLSALPRERYHVPTFLPHALPDHHTSHLCTHRVRFVHTPLPAYYARYVPLRLAFALVHRTHATRTAFYVPHHTSRSLVDSPLPTSLPLPLLRVPPRAYGYLHYYLTRTPATTFFTFVPFTPHTHRLPLPHLRLLPRSHRAPTHLLFLFYRPLHTHPHTVALRSTPTLATTLHYTTAVDLHAAFVLHRLVIWLHIFVTVTLNLRCRFPYRTLRYPDHVRCYVTFDTYTHVTSFVGCAGCSRCLFVTF